MINRALIQRTVAHEEVYYPSWAAAWMGFIERGYDIDFFTWQQLQAGEIDHLLDRETILVGGVVPCRYAFKHYGIEPPNIDYPDCLKPFLGREIRTTTLGNVWARYNDEGPTIFIKPRNEQKLFTGHTVSRFRDILRTSSLDRDTEVYESDPVEFLSEYRYYVHHHKVVSMGHYRGDALLYPDPEVVRDAVNTFRDHGAPVAYGIDFGRTSDGKTLLVEVNDGFALGSYGMLPVAYSLFIEDRWDELLGDLPTP